MNPTEKELMYIAKKVPYNAITGEVVSCIC